MIRATSVLVLISVLLMLSGVSACIGLENYEESNDGGEVIFEENVVEGRVLAPKAASLPSLKSSSSRASSTKAPTVKSTKAPTIKSTKAPTIKASSATSVKSGGSRMRF